VQLNPPLARAHANLSLERYATERRSRPVRPSQAIAAADDRAHYNLGLAFRQKGYYAEALHEYQLALDRGEDRQLALRAMGEVHLLVRDFAAALTIYDTLLHEEPQAPKLWNERGVVLHQMGRGDDALVCYRQAVEVDPKYALAWNNLGVALAQQGQSDEAIAALRQAQQLQPEITAARLNLALLLAHLRRYQLASRPTGRCSPTSRSPRRPGTGSASC
jgi:tetratricopeptide (TPR) repeat protein